MSIEDRLSELEEKLGALTVSGKPGDHMKPALYRTWLGLLVRNGLLRLCTVACGAIDGGEPYLPKDGEPVEFIEGGTGKRVTRPCRTYRCEVHLLPSILPHILEQPPETLLDYFTAHAKHDIAELAIRGRAVEDSGKDTETDPEKKPTLLESQDGILAQIPATRTLETPRSGCRPGDSGWLSLLEGLIRSAYTGNTPVLLRLLGDVETLALVTSLEKSPEAIQGIPFHRIHTMPPNQLLLGETRAVMLYVPGIWIGKPKYLKEHNAYALTMELGLVVHLINNGELFAKLLIKD